MKHSFACQALIFYGSRLPNHPGKWRVLKWLRSIVPTPKGQDIEVCRKNIRWCLNPSDYTEAHVFWLGEMDRWELFHIEQHMPQKGVFLDVGANFGYYGITLANRLQRNCVVHAFEPNEITFRRLLHNIQLNQLEHCVFAHQVALSNATGSAHLINSRPDNAGLAYISENGNGAVVRMTTLDVFTQDINLQRLDCIKIDVEGYEERVLLGAQTTIARFRPVILLELHPPLLKRAGSSVDRIKARLREFRYLPYVIQRKNLVPLEEMPSDLTNALCLPQSGPVC